jgi:DNA-binding FadR family transcriptional regulator
MATSVYEELREAILTGRFAPGQVLSENALATEYGKSRTPVREALHRLEINGKIDWVQIDLGEDSQDADHYIDPDERFRIAMTRQ